MNVHEQAYKIFREVAENVCRETGTDCTLGDKPDFEATLVDFGINLESMPDIEEELTRRLKGRKLGLEPFLTPQEFDFLTLGKTLDALSRVLAPESKRPLVVYVDDEEENLFVFNRKFGKKLALKMFTDPEAALKFIQSSTEVALVITDEFMPRLSGNELCDKVHQANPQLPFILITGNPNQDEDLLYRSLRRGRFFEFFQKPLDLDRKGEEYFKLIEGLIGKHTTT
jgi:CheY-like chemotaxis protein